MDTFFSRPRKSIFGNEWDDFHERLEDSLRDSLDEDDLLDRERDLREGQDIKDSYEEDESDDLVNINIG